jgi:hypothetical protein
MNRGGFESMMGKGRLVSIRLSAGITWFLVYMTDVIYTGSQGLTLMTELLSVYLLTLMTEL